MTSAKRTAACGRRGKTPAAFFFPLQTMHNAGTVLFVWFIVIIIRFPSHCFIPFSLYRTPRTYAAYRASMRAGKIMCKPCCPPLSGLLTVTLGASSTHTHTHQNGHKRTQAEDSHISNYYACGLRRALTSTRRIKNPFVQNVWCRASYVVSAHVCVRSLFMHTKHTSITSASETQLASRKPPPAMLATAPAPEGMARCRTCNADVPLPRMFLHVVRCLPFSTCTVRPRRLPQSPPPQAPPPQLVRQTEDARVECCGPPPPPTTTCIQDRAIAHDKLLATVPLVKQPSANAPAFLSPAGRQGYMYKTRDAPPTAPAMQPTPSPHVLTAAPRTAAASCSSSTIAPSAGASSGALTREVLAKEADSHPKVHVSPRAGTSSLSASAKPWGGTEKNAEEMRKAVKLAGLPLKEKGVVTIEAIEACRANGYLRSAVGGTVMDAVKLANMADVLAKSCATKI